MCVDSVQSAAIAETAGDMADGGPDVELSDNADENAACTDQPDERVYVELTILAEKLAVTENGTVQLRKLQV